MSERDPKKFDPARAHMLDAPERERFLPSAAIVALLQLSGGEVVLDYGAGTGRLTLPVADALRGGRVVAIEESPEMLARLREAVGGREDVEIHLIEANEVPLEDRTVDRVLAVNLLHEVRGEGALQEMRRLLADDGLLVVVDWERGRPRESGPPDRILYTAEEAIAELAAAGLNAAPAPVELPFHYALTARPAR